jgi:hypothetical protein
MFEKFAEIQARFHLETTNTWYGLGLMCLLVNSKPILVQFQATDVLARPRFFFCRRVAAGAGRSPEHAQDDQVGIRPQAASSFYFLIISQNALSLALL